MRIAQVVPAGANPHSGVPVVIVQLAVHLARRGHDLELWQLKPWSKEQAAVHLPALGDAGVPLIAPAAAGPRGYATLAGRSVDVVHLHSVFTPPNALLARRLRTPYVISPHGGYAPASLARNPGRKAVYGRLVERRMLRRAVLRVALTEVEARDVVAFGGGEPITIIPNGVAPVLEQVDRTVFRQELGLGPDDRLLLFVGRLDVFHKGLDVLLDGVAEAQGWHLALVGSDAGNGRSWLLEHARGLRMLSRLTLTGPRHDRQLHEAFAAADCFALTSRWEGLPVALLEALAHGVPSVVSPAVDRLVGVSDAHAGWVADAPELGALLRRLESLGARERARRGRAARALAAGYDWDAVAGRYETAYARVISSTHEGHHSDAV